MMRKIISVIICFLLAVTSLSAQKNLKNAQKAYAEGNYSKAIEEYTTLMEEVDDAQTKAEFRYYIGESYRKMNRPDRAEKYLSDAIKGGYMSGDIYRSLGEVQLKQGKYDDALSSFESYKRANPFDPLADIGIESSKYAKENTETNPFFDVKVIDRVNSRRNELGVSYFNDGLIFSSTRVVASDEVDDKKKKRRNKDDDEEEESGGDVYTRTGLQKARVFMAGGNNGTFSRPVEITDLNKMKDFANDGIFSYDPYSRQGFYARIDGKKSYIQFMALKGTKWEKKEKISVNSKSEPISHLFVTPDGNRIYFASTMEGGQGKSDIWYIERNGKGWSDPINAGDKVNTAGNEVYPIVADNYLFFASDGHVGYGGFDLYASKLSNSEPQKAFNLGLPFNTYNDDYNIAMRSDLKEGVFVTGRHEKWGDDIYYFKGMPFNIMASGVITNAETGEPVSNVKLELVQQKDNKVVSKAVTDTEGKYSIFAAPEQKYTLKATVAGYAPATKSITTDANRFALLNSKSGVNLDFKLTANASVISGRLFDRNTFVSVENQEVTLLSNGKKIQSVKTNADGIYKFGGIKENTQYVIKTTAGKYFGDSKVLNIGAITRNTEFDNNDFELELAKENNEILMNKVEFDQGKSTLLSDSYPELDRLAKLFIQNPNYKLLIKSYTDTKQASKQSVDLTTQRANAVKSYLTGRGVNSSQLATKGMGRTQLLVANARTEAEHKRNNRVTYTITERSSSSTPISTTPTVTVGGGTTQQPVNGGNTVVKTPVTQPGTQQPATSGGSKPEDLPFRIQVAALKQLDLNNAEFKRIEAGVNMKVRYELGASGWYRYYVGGFATREEADKMLAKLKSMNVNAASVKPKAAFAN